MHLFRAIVIAMSLLLAGTAAASERVQIPVRLVLVDHCTVHPGERKSADAIQVKCSSGQPHRVDRQPGDAARTLTAARAPKGNARRALPGLTVSF